VVLKSEEANAVASLCFHPWFHIELSIFFHLDLMANFHGK
jgi:hypothetical protein